MKLLEEHIVQNLGDLGHGHNFLHTTPKLMIRIEKNDKSTFIKTVIKSLLRELKGKSLSCLGESICESYIYLINCFPNIQKTPKT